MNSKWISDLYLTLKTIKLLEENRDVNLCDLGLGNDFLDMMPNTKQQEKKQMNGIHLKILNVCFKGHHQ